MGMLSVSGEDALHFARLLTVQNGTDPVSPHFRIEPSMRLMTNVGQLCHIMVKKVTNQDTQRGLSLLFLMQLGQMQTPRQQVLNKCISLF